MNQKHTFTKEVKNLPTLINNVGKVIRDILEQLKFCDPPEGPHNGAGSTPVAIPPVLPSSQEVLSASVVGVLVEDPVSIHNVTGVNMAVVETVRHTGTIVHELHHVATKVRLLEDAQPVGATILVE